MPSAPGLHSCFRRRGGSSGRDCHVPTEPDSANAGMFLGGQQFQYEPLFSFSMIGEYHAACFQTDVLRARKPTVRVGNWNCRNFCKGQLQTNSVNTGYGGLFSCIPAYYDAAGGVICKDNILGFQCCTFGVQCRNVLLDIFQPWQRGGWMSKHVVLTSGHVPAEPAATRELQQFLVPYDFSEMSCGSTDGSWAAICCTMEVLIMNLPCVPESSWQRGGWRLLFWWTSGHVPAEPYETPCYVCILERGEDIFLAALAYAKSDFNGVIPPCLNSGLLSTLCNTSFDGVLPGAHGIHDHIWDAMPWRLAGVTFSMSSLQRQNLLLVVHDFTNGQPSGFFSLGRSPTCGAPSKVTPLPHTKPQASQNVTQGWLCRMFCNLQLYLESLMRCIMIWIWTYAQCLGDWWQHAFIFLAATAGKHMCQLLLYAMQLKGGKCNADNLLHGSRRILWIRLLF